MPPSQEKLLEAVFAVNTRVVLVLFSNYPYAINFAQEKLPAILWSATGAQDMGAAIAETLLGHNNPAGRLNMTWYQGDHQLPDMDDYDVIGKGRTYRYFEGEALYPFGHGLSYTQFTYSDLTVTLQEGTRLCISLQVENTGSRVGDEVVQIYGTAPASRVKKPLRQLLGFRRLKNLIPGEWSYLFNLDMNFDGGRTPWHCADIPYFFHNTEFTPYTQETGVTERVEKLIFDSVMAFARTGNPQNPEMPDWPACTPEKETTLVIGKESAVKVNFDHELLPLLVKAMGPVYARNMEKRMQDVQH